MLSSLAPGPAFRGNARPPRFRIEAPPGHYTLTAKYSSGPGGCPPVDLDVKAGRFTRADMSRDTGTR